MPKEEYNAETVFKEMGGVMKKVLFYLAENPESCKQKIQRDIHYPDKQYGTISNSVKSLKKQGYIQFKKAKSQKNKEMNNYFCTELGVFYALTRNPNPDIPKILDAYKSQIEFCKGFQGLYNILEHNLFAILKDIQEFLPMIQKDGFSPTNQVIMIIKLAKIFENLDQETRQKFIEEALRQFPQSKKLVNQHQNIINEIAHNFDQANIRNNE
jgi:hypothetical protein